MIAGHRWPDGRTPVLLTAHADDLVGVDARAIVAYLKRRPGVDDVAAHLLRTRRLRRHRAVVRAGDLDELAAGLRAVVAGDEHPLVARSVLAPAPRVAFVFPGQGSQWPGMGADAYRLLPVYRAAADACAAAFIAAGTRSPLRYLTTSAETEMYAEIEVEGAQFIHGVALAAVWRACGIAPDLTVGHSLGEIAAAYVAESITLADAVAVVAARAATVQRMSGRYAVAALGIGADAARELIAAIPGWLELSVINAPSSVAVSGDREAIAAAVQQARCHGNFAREITVNFPVHTSVLDPLRDELRDRLPDSVFADAPVQFIGSATGDVVAPGTEFADYWFGNLRHLVRFDRAAATAIRSGTKVFIELSAHPSLLFALGQILDQAGVADVSGDAVLVGSGHRNEPLAEQLSASIAAVAVADPGYRWTDLMTPPTAPLSDFPNAPMRPVHLWAEPESLPSAPAVTVAVERWTARPPVPVADAAPRIAVRALVDDDALTERLRAAVEGRGLPCVPPEQADIVVVTAPSGGDTDPVRAAEQISTLAGVLDYPNAVGAQCRTVWLVTVGGEQVLSSDPVALPLPAALAAMHRSVGFDHPELGFSRLDLPSVDLDDAMAAATVDTLLGEVTEVAVRDSADGPTRFVHETPEDSTVAPAWPLHTGLLDEVVITGGAGAIGMRHAEYFARHGARRIVLLGRQGANPASVRDLAEQHGVDVVAPPCDLTDPGQVATVAAEFGGGGASLVIHAAGAARFGPADRLTADAWAATFAAKVAGLAHLTELWPIRPDARILLCSSVSGLWGGQGHAAYSAANRLLDTMAGQLRAAGRHCVAVRWGLWGAGIVDADEVARIERSGLRQMAPDAAIEASLRDYPADPLIMSADRDRLRTFLDSRRATENRGTASASAPDTTGVVRQELASVLSVVDAMTLDLASSLLDLGVDSLLALDLRKRLKRATGQNIALARLLGGITGSELIAELAGSDNVSEEKVEFSRD